MQRKYGPGRRLALHAVSTLLGVVVALAVVEGLLRIFGLAPTEGLATVTEQEFHSVPGLLSPNQQLIDRRIRALPHRVSVNDLGYRGPQFARDKAAGEVRILMAGDSFTYGEFVNEDETLPAQVERELGLRCVGVRTINAGVGGTTIDTHSRIIERALPLKPDLVLLTFSENDLEDLDGTSAWDRFAANRATKSRFPLSIAYPVLNRLALWHFGLEAREKLRARFAVSAAGGHKGGAPLSEARRAWGMRQLDVYMKALRTLRDRLDGEGVALILILYPSHFSLPKSASTEQLEWLVRAGTEAGIPTVNLQEPLRQSGSAVERLYLLPEDGHPSAHGYAVAAAFLAQVLERADALKSSCTTAGHLPATGTSE